MESSHVIAVGDIEEGQLDFLRHPIAKTGGPASSFQAGTRVQRLGITARHRRWVLRLVVKYPGSTSKQLASLSKEPRKLDRYQVARRLPELLRGGYVKRLSPERGEILWFPRKRRK